MFCCRFIVSYFMIQSPERKIAQRRRIRHRVQHTLAGLYHFRNLETVPMPFFLPQYLIRRYVKIEDSLRLSILSTLRGTPDQKTNTGKEDHNYRRDANHVE